MCNSARFALLLAAVLLSIGGASFAQDEEAPVEGPERDGMLTQLSAFVKDLRLTDQEVVKFIELAESFEDVVDDSDLGEKVEAALEAGQPFAEVFLAHPTYKAWIAEKKVDGTAWLQTFLRVQLLLAREEVAGNIKESDEMFAEMLKDLEQEREEMGEEAYAETKQDLEEGRAEQAREMALWLKLAPVPTEAETALLTKHMAGIRKATGRSASDDEDGMEPGSEEMGAEEDPIQLLKREVGAHTAFTRDFRLSEAGLAKFVSAAQSFKASDGEAMIKQALAESIHSGKPFGEVFLARPDYQIWANRTGVDRQLFIRTLIRLRLIHESESDREGTEADRLFHQEALSGLKEQRANLGEEAYWEARAALEADILASEERAAIWRTVPVADETEQALIQKHVEATRAALAR